MMMDKIKKAIRFIFAEGEDFTLENRLLISAVIIGTLTGVMGSLINLFLSTSMTAVLVPIALSALLFLLYYFLRFKKIIQPFLIPMIVISLFGISAIWVFNGGINGSNILPAFVILILALVSVADKIKKYVIILFLILNISIYSIQFLKPEWITNFPSETDRWIDALITMIYSSFFIYLIIKYLHKNYNLERLKVEDSEKKLLKINADKDLFISILAHDLKSPFNNLLGLSELLAENSRTFDPDKIQNLAIGINKSARNTYNLLDELLIWANAQSGKFPFKPQKLNLEAVLLNCLELLNPFIQAKGIIFKQYFPTGATIFADQYMLNTILRNLISNAIKFTHKGGQITVTAEKTASAITISVSDTGVGISSDLVNNLFALSRTYSTDGTEKEKGSGLGLFICREFVEKHQGKIQVESIVGQGSIFSFTLPIPIS